MSGGTRGTGGTDHTRYTEVSLTLPRVSGGQSPQSTQSLLLSPATSVARSPKPPDPNACCPCGKHCVPSNLENWIRPNGRWAHLECELAQP
jgi:hypothetical protein